MVSAAAISIMLGTPSLASSPNNWTPITYQQHMDADITCGTGAVCDVILAKGDSLKRGAFGGGVFVGESESGTDLWQHSSFVEGVDAGHGSEPRPHLSFVAARPNLHASAVVVTDRHSYNLSITSIDGFQSRHFYYTYPAAVRHTVAAIGYAAYSRPQPKPVLNDPLSQMNRACSDMRGDQYGIQVLNGGNHPEMWQPVRVCHSYSRTFVRMPDLGRTPTDILVPREVIDSGDVPVVFSYDSGSRVYGIDLVPNEIVLTLGTEGKRQLRVRIQRQAVPVALKR